jgi:glycosyltransferase involved in cell wall biosynthesis
MTTSTQPQINQPTNPAIAHHRISTVIIAQNESECIANAIRSCIPFSDEIVVVDGGSQDDTVQIAETLACKVYHHPWSGYANQRNFGADQAEYDWIFFIDADEVVDQKLTEALLDWKQTPNLTANAFSALRIGDFWNRWLDSRPEAHTRLYNKQVFRIKDVLVHEGPNIGNAPVIKLPGVIWHYGFRDLSDLVIRFNRYTDLDAQQAHRNGQRFSLLRLLLKPSAKFLQQYLWYGLYRQGLAGFALAGLWSYYMFLKELKLYELDWQVTHHA